MSKELPKLREGLSYGAPIEAIAKTLQVGDVLNVPGSRHVAPQAGRITRIKRTKLDYETTYFGNPLTLDLRISDLSGGYIMRGSTVYPVI
jgi:hypothetical protein